MPYSGGFDGQNETPCFSIHGSIPALTNHPPG